MFFYKTSWCPTKKDSHDSKSCIYAHHTRDFRRPPDLFKYAPEDCETLQNGMGWDYCKRGIKCAKCHTTVERLYHPDKYKRIECDRSRCNKMDICAFFHTSRDKGLAHKLCKQYLKSRQGVKLPDISQLNSELLQAYAEEQQKQYQLEQQQTLGVTAVRSDFEHQSFRASNKSESPKDISSQNSQHNQYSQVVWPQQQSPFPTSADSSQFCSALDPNLLQAESFKPTFFTAKSSSNISLKAPSFHQQRPA